MRFLKIRDPKVLINDEEFKEEMFFFTDSSFFEIFPYKLISGSQEDAMLYHGSIVISNELSKKYFNDINPLGETLSVNGIDYTITGIIDNTPKSHFAFNALLSMQPITKLHQLQESDLNVEGISNREEETVYTYILTNHKVRTELLGAKLKSYYSRFSVKEYSYQITLQPLPGIHFNDKKLENDFPTMDKKYIYILVVLLVIILVFNTLNYINLMIGNSLKTGRLIGLNKLLEKRKRQIFTYFISDSFLNAVMAIIISILLMSFIIPHYNEFFNKNLTLNILANKSILKNILILLAIIGIVPGMILGFLFIPTKPFLIHKNQLVKRNVLIRELFVFLEISLLISVVFGIITISFQLHKLKNKNLGFNEKNIALIHIQNPVLAKNALIFKNRIKENRNVFQLASSDVSVGVVKDYHWESKHMKVRPHALMLLADRFRDPYYLSVRITGSDFQKIIKSLQKDWDYWISTMTGSKRMRNRSALCSPFFR